MKKKLIIWCVIPALLYFLVCYFKIEHNNQAFLITLSVFLVFLIKLFYKIYEVHKED